MRITASYEDAVFFGGLRRDGILRLCCGVLPTGGALSSQPTMSGFEQKPGHSDLYRMAEVFVDNFIGSRADQPTAIASDCEDTNSDI